MGSTEAARRAGRDAAKDEQMKSKIIAPAITKLSIGVTSYSRLESNRVDPKDAANPIAAPIAVSETACRIVRRQTRSRVAPRAIRIAISVLRSATENAMTP